jgi:hypothetical protein
VNLMSSPERFQNVVLGGGEAGDAHETLSIITEECGVEIALSSIGDYDEPPDIDRGCRC